MCLRLAVLTLLAANPASGQPGTTGKPHRWTPAERCVFSQPPALPYYWDESCKLNNQAAGCWADGVHSQCRFCGQGPFTGVRCPINAIAPDTRLCAFDNAPTTPYYWEPRCRLGIKGCYADGQHVGCRFCGANGYEDIPCPASACNFANEPWNPYYWDDFCQWGSLGCNADGHHIQCRFCDKVPFQSIPCPENARPAYPDGSCWFPVRDPSTSYYWDDQCKWGMKGCWADGVNAQCRFCGSGPYEDIPCPEENLTHPEEPSTTDPDEPDSDDAVSSSTPASTDPDEPDSDDAVSPDTQAPTDPAEPDSDDSVAP